VNKTFDLVIFDCDGVVIDSEVISARMLIEVLAMHGVHVDRAYVAKHFLGRSYPIVLAQIRTDFGISLPDGFEAAYRARLLEAFDKNLTVMPGVTRVLERLSVPFCLATSSSPERVERCLGIVGLASVFAGLVTTSVEVAKGKPAPDLFLLAAKKMGVEPDRCLVVEDSLAGIRAGVSAGMTVCHFVGGSHLRGLDISDDSAVRADRQIASFDEFFDSVPDLDRSFAV